MYNMESVIESGIVSSGMSRSQLRNGQNKSNECSIGKRSLLISSIHQFSDITFHIYNS